MRKITDNRMELYESGMTDHEIAEELDVTLTAISQWRYVRKLKTNKKFKRKEISPQCGVSFRKALPPGKHEPMLRFLVGVDTYKPKDMMGFMSAFNRGVEL